MVEGGIDMGQRRSLTQQTPMEVIQSLEQSIEKWKMCDYTSDEFSIRLAHASRDFNIAVDYEEEN